MHSPGLQTVATSSSDDVKSRDLDPCSKEGSSSVHLLLAGVRVHAAYQWRSWGKKKLWHPATLRYFWNIVLHLSTQPPNFRFAHQPVLSLAHSTKWCYWKEKVDFTVFWNPQPQQTKQKRRCCWPGLRLQKKINPRWRKQWLLFTSTHDTDTNTGVCGLLLAKS